MFRSTKEMADRWPGAEERHEVDDSETYNCDLCSDGEWYSETEVELHKQTAHKKELLKLLRGDTELLCKLCIKNFSTNEDLIKHIKTHHLLSSEDAPRVERELFICDICHMLFFNKKHLAVHIAYSHLRINCTKRLIECPRCFKNVKGHGLWFHFQMHKVQSIAVCPICLHKFKSRSHLRSHLKVHKKYLFCDICQYDTKKEDLFKQHVKMRHQNNVEFGSQIDKYFMPSVEEIKLVRVSGFKGLLLMNNVRVCILCRHICVTVNEMTEHIKEHTFISRVESVNYLCVCGESFTNKVLLKHHVFKLKGVHQAAS